MKERGEKQFPEMNPEFCYEKKLYQCHFGYQALKLRIVHYEKLNLKILGGIKSRTKRVKMLEFLTFIQFKLYCIQLHLKPRYYGPLYPADDQHGCPQCAQGDWRP